jgi:hypothetical protein
MNKPSEEKTPVTSEMPSEHTGAAHPPQPAELSEEELNKVAGGAPTAPLFLNFQFKITAIK